MKVEIIDTEEDEVGPMADTGGEDQEDEAVSSLTMERVAAAKKFIESHYRSQMKHIEERKERYLFFFFLFFIFVKRSVCFTLHVVDAFLLDLFLLFALCLFPLIL